MITQRNSFDDSGQDESSWYSTKSTCSVHSNEDDDDKENIPPLIFQRLMKTGIIKSEDEYELVPDFISKEVAGLYNEEDKTMFDREHDRRVVTHVKTGVWEVQCFDDDGTPLEPFYVVTGVSMDDRIDTKKLRNALFKERTTTAKSTTRRPKLCLAPTEIAKRRTGYKSGTMLPICHSVAMQLFLDETIFVNERDEYSDHKIQCGSGIFDQCLSISADTFLQIANTNPCDVTVCSLIQNKKKNEPPRETTAP